LTQKYHRIKKAVIAANCKPTINIWKDIPKGSLWFYVADIIIIIKEIQQELKVEKYVLGGSNVFIIGI
jgi:hypothetical protein